LSKLAVEKGVSDQVKFTDNLSICELEDEYDNASLFVLLSTSESYGICVAEALSCRTPCIVSNTSALSEWIDNRVCFGANLPINHEDLALQISSILSGNFDVTAFDDFFGKKIISWDEATNKLEKLYYSI